MKSMNQLEILARALLGGLVDLHGRQHAAHILEALAKGVAEGLPIDGRCRCNAKRESESVETVPDQSAEGRSRASIKLVSPAGS